MQCWWARAGRARSAAPRKEAEGSRDRGGAEVDGVRQSEVGWRASARAVALPTRARLDAGSRSILTGSSGSARRGEVVWRARRRCRFATPPLGSGPRQCCRSRASRRRSRTTGAPARSSRAARLPRGRCVSPGATTMPNQDWALDTVGRSGRRRQPRERSATQHGLCEAGAAASRRRAPRARGPLAVRLHGARVSAWAAGAAGLGR